MSWIGIRDFAARYGVSVHTAYKLAQKNLVPFGRVGRRLVFNIDDCDAWARQRGSSGRMDFPVSEEKAQAQAQLEEVEHIASEIFSKV